MFTRLIHLQADKLLFHDLTRDKLAVNKWWDAVPVPSSHELAGKLNDIVQ